MHTVGRWLLIVFSVKLDDGHVIRACYGFACKQDQKIWRFGWIMTAFLISTTINCRHIRNMLASVEQISSTTYEIFPLLSKVFLFCATTDIPLVLKSCFLLRKSNLFLFLYLFWFVEIKRMIVRTAFPLSPQKKLKKTRQSSLSACRLNLLKCNGDYVAYLLSRRRLNTWIPSPSLVVWELHNKDGKVLLQFWLEEFYKTTRWSRTGTNAASCAMLYMSNKFNILLKKRFSWQANLGKRIQLIASSVI